MDEIVKVRAAFVADKESGDVTAVFDEKWETCNGIYNACYAHVGQHGPCSREWVVEDCREATHAEYAALLKELVDYVGYDVEVVPVSSIKFY